MSRTRDMTLGDPSRLIFTFSLPLILTNMGQQLYMIADAAIVGRGLGVRALAAVGATDWSYWVILWSITTMTQGFGTFVARYFGKKDYAGMNAAIGNSVILSMLTAAVLTAVGLMLARPVLVLLKTPADILDDSVTYLSTMVAGSLIVAGYNIATSVLRALGDGKSPMIAMAIAAVLNVGLDLFAVFVLHWGVFGVALASVLSQLTAFLYCAVQIRRVDGVALKKETFRPDLKMMKELLAFGLPLALQYMIINFSGMILQSTVNLQGSVFVAGYTATNKLYGLLECSAISLGFSSTTFFSQNYGAKRYDRLRTGMRATIGIGIGMALVIGAVAAVFGRQLVQLFLDAAEADTEQAVRVGYRYLLAMAASLIVLFLIYAYRSALQSLGSSVPSMISGFTECAARILMAKGVYEWVGARSLYFAEPVAWLGSLAFIMAAYYVLRSRYLPARQ